MEKVTFRQIEKDDLPLLRDWRNQEGVRKFCREYRLLNMINQQDWFERVSNSKEDDMFLIVVDDKPVGVCGLTHINWKDRHCELSWYLGDAISQLKKVKIAPKISQFLRKKGFEEYNLNRLWAEIYSFNDVMIKYVLRRGFKQEGILRQSVFWDGKYWDSVVLSMLSEEYFKKKKM